MNSSKTLSRCAPVRVRRACPTCGIVSAALMVALPSGRQALIEACPICGRQAAAYVAQALEALLPDSKDMARRSGGV